MKNYVRCSQVRQQRASKKLATERADLDSELRKILTEIGHSEPSKTHATERRKRRCKLCGTEGHIVARKKTADGCDTCPTYPKPLAAE